MIPEKMKNSFKTKKKYKMSSYNTQILNFIEDTLETPPNKIITLGCTNDDGISIVSGLIRNQNDGTQALTTSIQYDASDQTNFNSAIQTLLTIYQDIIQKYPNVIWIYTALNVNSNVDRGVSHQNWLCYNVKTNTLYRFEPSENYDEFRIPEFCNLICLSLGAAFVDNVYMINHHNMCKAYSSLIIIYFILTRNELRMYDNDTTNAIILDTIIKELGRIYNMNNNPHPKPTRRHLGYIIA